jgi:hypothetical protein
MNRQARRAADAAKRRPNTLTLVEKYRVPAGRIALTFDIQGRNPSTIAINAESLVDVLDSVGQLVADKSYPQVLHLLAAIIQAADEGVAGAWNGAILGFWLVCHHPSGGAEMAARLADAIALGRPAHITMHVGAGGIGLAFGLGDRFADLDQAAAMARKAGVASFIVGEPRRQRPGGRA